MEDKKLPRELECYLQEIRGELRDMPARTRNEFVEEIRSHLLDEWENAAAKSSAAVYNIMEKFGDPREIAAEFRGKQAPVNQANYPPVWLVIVLTAILWPIGIILAWISPAWRLRDKVIATLIPIVLLAVILLTSFAAFTRYSVEIDGPQGRQPVLHREQEVRHKISPSN